MTPEETTNIAVSETNEKAQVAIIAQASILNIEKNKKAYEDLRDEYAGITLPEFKDPDFKKVHKKITEGSGKLVKARTAADKLVKSEIAVLKEVEVMIKQAGEDLKAITIDTEREIKALKETAENLVEEDKQEQLRLAEEKKQARIAKLFELGLTYNGGNYSIGDLAITPVMIVQYSDNQFDGFVSQATAAYEAEQLRIAEEKAEAERLSELARQEQQKRDEEQLAQQQELTRQNQEQQAIIDADRREKELMRLERTEHRVDVLHAKGFEGDLKKGVLEYSSFAIKAGFICDATKSEWDARMVEFADYLESVSKPKEEPKATTPPQSNFTVVPVSSLPFIPEDEDEVPSANPIVVDEPFVAPPDTEKVVLLHFTNVYPFIDSKVGKSTLRLYPELFVEEAGKGLTKDDIAASGSISSDLLFYVIKGVK